MNKTKLESKIERIAGEFIDLLNQGVELEKRSKVYNRAKKLYMLYAREYGTYYILQRNRSVMK